MYSSYKQLSLFFATVLLSWGKMSSSALISQIRDLVESSNPDYKIFLVRHGNTPANRADLIQGWLDVDLDKNNVDRLTYKLDDLGKQQAVNAANKLSQVTIGKIFSCPLSRALDTAKIIQLEHPGVRIVQNQALRGLGFGEWEGKNVALTRQNLNWVDGKVYKGESVKTYEGRTIQFLEEEVFKPQSRIRDPTNILISTHQWSIKVMMQYVEKMGATKARGVDLTKDQLGGSISEIRVWLKGPGGNPHYHIQRFGEKADNNPLA